MANLIEIYNSKFNNEKIVGENNFFNSTEELVEVNNLQKKFISNVNYSFPENFAKFGSAEEYYKNAISYIDSEYPYDACTEDKSKWINSLNDLEYYIFLKEFPKTTGYITLTNLQYLQVKSFAKNSFVSSKETYDEFNNLNSNTYFSFQNTFTFESWLKFEDDTDTTNVINIVGITGSAEDLQWLDVFTINRTVDTYPRFQITDGTNTYYFNSQINANEWHHYAFNVSTSSVKLFIDGQLTEELTDLVFSTVNDGYIFTTIGLMDNSLYNSVEDIEFSGQFPVFQIGRGGKLSVDECRMWNGSRTVEKIGRYWFTTINGNDPNSITEDTNLLFYYKFNEGWDEDYKFLCLDSSGRQNDAEIQLYEVECRNIGSAINECGFVEDIEQPDIIVKGLQFSTTVKDYYNTKIKIGKDYDETNIHALYNKFPGWLLEQEEDNKIKHLKQIVQIVSSYFDDLYNKIKEITNYKTVKYSRNEENIYPFYDKILTSTGFDVTELFSNLDMIEKISSRNDITIFDEDVQKIKNSIFQNIYNNLAYILKSKGTEKSIKTFLKSYGINEDLVRINLYADSGKYYVTDRYKEVISKKKTLTTQNSSSVYLSGSAVIEDSSLRYYTLETSVVFPQNLSIQTGTTASLFGVQNNGLEDISWISNNSHYYVTLQAENDGFRFYLTDGLSNIASGSLINNLYNNTVWNICLRKTPNIDSVIGSDTGSLTYNMELYGVNYNSSTKQEFSCSLPYDNYNGYLRYYLGARKTDLTGNLMYGSASKFLYCNFWTNYLDNETIINHNRKILNYGTNE